MVLTAAINSWMRAVRFMGCADVNRGQTPNITLSRLNLHYFGAWIQPGHNQWLLHKRV